MDKITIIVPCYNEAEVIPRFYEAVTAATAAVEDCVFSYLFIDDGSRDGTLDAIRALADAHDSVRYLSFTRNFGKEPAMMAGLDFADGDAVLIMDADLQHPPALIPTMVAAWREGYDDVCGKRTDRKDETFLKRTMANFFYRSMQAVSRFTLQRDVGDFRLLDHRCVAALRLLRENQRFTKGLFTWVGFKKKEIPFQVQPRAAGKTTWSYLALLSLGIIGEYLGRVFTESKRRPCYLIDELDGEKFDNTKLAGRRYIDTGE